MEGGSETSAPIGGRYHPVARLGRGAHGDVWRARDRITGATVAVKRIATTEREATYTRREVAALRATRVPGVVRLLDEGRDGDTDFVVLECVEGDPFPGAVEHAFAWESVAPVAIELLEIVGRIHATGVLHLDLKPSNVLVREGRPVVLDFGLTWGVLGDADAVPRSVAGTPAYMAPEQVQRAELTPATDLYAVGVMLFEALAGRLPFEGASPMAAMLSRCVIDAPRLDDVPGCDAPTHVCDTVRALLQRDPAKRPSRAQDVIDALRGRPSALPAPIEVHGPPLDRATLAQCVHGPERFFHVVTDAVEHLLSRTNGDRSAVLGEMDSWVRAGFARRTGSGVRLDRVGLEQLLEPQRPLAHSAGEALRLAVDDALVYRERGNVTRALARLADAWLTAYRLGDPISPSRLQRFFSVWAALAVTEGTAASADRMLYELSRAADFPGSDDLATLLRAWHAVYTDPRRAVDACERLPRFDDPTLQRLAHDVRVRAARLGPLDGELDAVASLRPWADASSSPEDRALFETWVGWTCYRRGRYLDAVGHHLAAADLDPSPLARLVSLLAAASTLLEGFSPARAALIATEAETIAARCRAPYLEARAAWLVRMARYRQGESLPVDHALLDALEMMGGGNPLAVALLTEAAFAWRAQDFAAADALATRSSEVFLSIGRPWAPDMARALAIASGAPVDDAEVTRLTTNARACPVVGAGLQVLALLALAGHATVHDPDELDKLTAGIARVHHRQRMAVLSVMEATEALTRRRVSPTTGRTR